MNFVRRRDLVGGMVPFALALVVGLAAAPALAGDLIQRRDGTFLPPQTDKTLTEPSTESYEASNYTVVDADSTKVTYRIEGLAQIQSIPSDQVMRLWIAPDDQPAEFRASMGDFRAGAMEDAMGGFLAIGENKNAHKVLRQEAFLYAVRAAASAGEMKAAEDAAKAYAAAFPSGFYRLEVLQETSNGWLAAGNFEKALEKADELSKTPGLSDTAKINIEFLRASVELRRVRESKDTAAIKKVRESFSKVLSTTSGKKELASLAVQARLGEAKCDFLLGEFANAKKAFELIVSQADADRDLAEAYNGLGMCHFQEGNRPGWTAARRCFLRVSLLYTNGTPNDELALALFMTAECFFRLQDTPDWKRDARMELAECMRRFPGPWQIKAAQLDGNIRNTK
jgi:tetratricopeptide (TPR) repeat protein